MRPSLNETARTFQEEVSTDPGQGTPQGTRIFSAGIEGGHRRTDPYLVPPSLDDGRSSSDDGVYTTYLLSCHHEVLEDLEDSEKQRNNKV
eukprot:scaffold17487_cov133-Skeletonema_marinoi.AAC.4